MKIIPLEAVPNQKINVVLSQQNCSIRVYQKSSVLYMDLAVSNTPLIFAGMVRDRVSLVRSSYLHFLGKLMFVDTQGRSDPDYTGLNTRWLLTYFEDGE